MVDLVLHGAGEEFFAFGFEPVAIDVLCSDFNPCRAFHLFADLGEAQAAFFFELAAAAVDDLGVDEGLSFSSGLFLKLTSMTVRRWEMLICGAAMPIPCAAYMDSNISSTSCV